MGSQGRWNAVWQLRPFHQTSSRWLPSGPGWKPLKFYQMNLGHHSMGEEGCSTAEARIQPSGREEKHSPGRGGPGKETSVVDGQGRACGGPGHREAINLLLFFPQVSPLPFAEGQGRANTAQAGGQVCPPGSVRLPGGRRHLCVLSTSHSPQTAGRALRT